MSINYTVSRTIRLYQVIKTQKEILQVKLFGFLTLVVLMILWNYKKSLVNFYNKVMRYIFIYFKISLYILKLLD